MACPEHRSSSNAFFFASLYLFLLLRAPIPALLTQPPLPIASHRFPPPLPPLSRPSSLSSASRGHLDLVPCTFQPLKLFEQLHFVWVGFFPVVPFIETWRQNPNPRQGNNPNLHDPSLGSRIPLRAQGGAGSGTAGRHRCGEFQLVCFLEEDPSHRGGRIMKGSSEMFSEQFLHGSG